MTMNLRKRIQVLSCIAVGAISASSAIAQDVVRPEVAYPYEVEVSDDRLLLNFAILDGYYLYRDKFSFGVESSDVTLGRAEFPTGEIHEDEFFGEQEIYRHEFRISIPYANRGDAGPVDLQVRLQGCADIGLCYPPQRWSRTVELPANAGGGLADSFFSRASDEPIRRWRAAVGWRVRCPHPGCAAG
jgi:thiol:disulfide interchange protein DsbD